MRTVKSLPTCAQHQHLEFFQWFSTRFNARRIKVGSIGKVAFKAIPGLPIGLAYSKHRGVEMIEKSPVCGWHEFGHDKYGSEPYLPPSTIEERLQWWKQNWEKRGIPAADLRLTVTLHTIFAWHPSKS